MNRIVYMSRGGNTKKIADAIAQELGESAIAAERYSLSDDADILFVGASIYGGSIDGKLRSLLTSLNPSKIKQVAVFGTSAGKKTALAEIKSLLNPRGICVCDDEFHCQGSFLLTHRGRPNGDDLSKAKTFAKRITVNNE